MEMVTGRNGAYCSSLHGIFQVATGFWIATMNLKLVGVTGNEGFKEINRDTRSRTIYLMVLS
jgi:hypothetical protein